jgi:uncharacterized membrane protein YhaH (DUF805 family)
MPYFFTPVLDALSYGRTVRKAVAVALRVLGILLALGGLVLAINILKYSFRPDTTTEATLGGVLFAIVLLAAFVCVVEIHFYRARSVDELGETALAVIPVASVLCRLAGEVWATLLMAVGVGGCFFLALAKVSPLAFLSEMGGLLPAANLEASFLGGALLLLQMCVLALVVLVGSYLAAEGLLLALDVAGNVRRLAEDARPHAEPSPATEFCRLCGAPLTASTTYCANCGTRV